MTGELKVLKKKTCVACEANLKFFKDQLAEMQAANYRLIRANENLMRDVGDLHNANGDLRLRLNEAETRGIATSYPQHSSRDPFSWSQRNHSHSQYSMTAEERRMHLLFPNPPK